MPHLNPQQVAAKWTRNLSAAGESIRQGVMAVTESPTAKAAQAQDRFLAGVQASVASGKWQRGLQRVTLEDWRQSMLEKGLNRIATGAAAAEGKMTSFMTEWLPFEERVVSALPPRGTLEQNIQRAVEVMQKNAAFRRSA